MRDALTFIENAAQVTAQGLLNGVLGGVAVFAVTAVVLLFTPKASAATRHFVWWVVLLVVAGAPFVAGPGEAAPGAPRATAPPAPTTDDAPDSCSPMPRTWVASPGAVSLARSDRTLASVADPNPAPAVAPLDPRDLVRDRFWSLPDLPRSWAGALFLVWALGASLALTRVLRGCRTLGRLKTTSGSLPDIYQKRVDRIRELCRCRRKTDIRHSPMVSAPLTVGFFRPQILLPCKLVEYLDPRELDQILAHEIGHVRRYDDWTTLLQRLLSALLWFHPAVRWIGRRLDFDREVACDDAVVALTRKPRQLAACLTRLAEIAAGPRISAIAPSAVGPKSQLSRRIQMLLDSDRNTSPRPSLLTCVAVLAVAAMLGFPLVNALPTMAMTPPQERPQEKPAAAVTTTNTATTEPCCSTRASVPEAPEVPEEDHGFKDNGCTYEVSYRGAIGMAPDLETVREVPEGGHVKIIVTRGGHTTRYTVTRGPDGKASEALTVDGKPQDLTNEKVQDRLADIMDEVCDHTALGARSRVARITRREGIEGVVEAIDDLESNFAKRRYIEEALRLDASPDICAALARCASRELGQGHLVPAMALIAKRHTGDRQLTYELVRVLRHVNSTSLRTRALTTVASVRPLTGLAARDFLTFARTSCGGCGRPEILTRAMEFYLDDRKLRGEYFTALESCNDANVRRAVVRAVLDRRDLDEELMTQLMGVAEKLGSPYEKARAYVSVARRTTSPTLLARIIGNTRNLNHDGARKVVLDAVLARKDLADSNVDRVLSAIGWVSSNHRKSALLLATLPHCPKDAVSHLLEVAANLSGDPDRRQILAAVLDRTDLDEYTLQRVFEGMRQLQSDARKAALLVRAAPRTTNTLVIPYLETTYKLRSDAEKTRALMALLDKKDLAAEHIVRIKKHVPEHFSTKSARETVLAAVEARSSTDDD